jgi:hypothetical protein
MERRTTAPPSCPKIVVDIGAPSTSWPLVSGKAILAMA